MAETCNVTTPDTGAGRRARSGPGQAPSQPATNPLERQLKWRAAWLGVGFLFCLCGLALGAGGVAAQEGPQPLGNGTAVYESDRIDGAGTISDLISTDDGGAIALQPRATPAGNASTTVLRVDGDGNLRSSETVKGQLDALSRVSDDGYAAAGTTSDGDAVVAWIRSDGTVAWVETYGGDGRDVALDTASAPDGDAYVMASTESFGVETSDLWVLRIDGDGDVVWDRLVEHDSWTAFPKGERLKDGSLIATIRTKRSMDKEVDGKQNVSTVRITPDGDVDWRTVISSPMQPQDKEEMFDVIPAHGEGVLIAGSSNSGNERSENFDAWAARVSPAGDVRWQKTYESSVRTWVTQAVRIENGYMLAGFRAVDEDQSEGMVMGIMTNGTEYGRNTYGQSDSFDDAVGGITWTADDSIWIAGHTRNLDADRPVTRTWITDMSRILPVESAPSTWETQHTVASTGGDGSPGGDTGGAGNDSGNGSAGAAVVEDVPDSSIDLVLYGGTALAVVSLFVPYGLRRRRRS